MRRFALSLLLLSGAMAPAARAEVTRSLGVTVSPLGAFAVSRMREGVVSGMSGGLDWDFQKDGVWISTGGHVASSVVFTEATPLRLRVGPTLGRFHPFVGVGMSLLLSYESVASAVAPSLRIGGELSAGGAWALSEWLFLSAEARYQNFSLLGDPLSSRRQELVSAYGGVGFRL